MVAYESQFWILIDVLIAAVLSSLIGLEREKLSKPAGLRTNMIVGSISCFFVSISPTLSNFIQSNIEHELISVDPIRILQAIIVGVSFIGAGTILKSKEENTVQNLTTASTLLYSTGIGISVALNAYVIALGLALIGLIINSLHHWRKMRSFFSRRKK
ncbi:MgtC/SapB family protein [Sunxiuqinia sp. sy24]|uniref:MgtC/SapB family protein n=1 Tax=Sunxiuqinia sp. sy24 TaxID=3461495 RepID=UPI00404624E9